MDLHTPPGDAPDQGNNGSPLDLDEFVQNALLSAESKDDSLRAFIQHGRTNKDEAARLFSFCQSPDFSWFNNEDDSNSNNSTSNSTSSSNNSSSNNSSNNATARPKEPCDSTDMSASSSSSSQNPPTQPQTPTLTHNSSIGLEYHIPDDDDVDLKTFLLWLLGSQPQRIPQDKVKKLYDMSRLPGHGTDGGFQALIKAALSPNEKTGPAGPVAAPVMAEIQSPNAGVPHVERQSAFPQGFLPHSYQQDQLPHLYHHPHANLYMHQAQVDHSRPLGPPSPYSNAFMPHPSMPATLQQENASVPQFVSPAALSHMDGNPNLVSPSTMSPSMAHGDSVVNRENATSSAARASSLEPSPIVTSQGPRQQSNGPQSIAQASPEPSEAAASPTGDLGNKIQLTCPISKDCNKSVASDNSTNAYKYLIEHIRRIHPDNYIQGLPSNKESVEKMITMEVALCTISVNGAPCDFRVAGQKGQRAPWRQALDHVREAHPEKDTQGLTANKASFLALMNGGIVVRCPLPNKDDGSPCQKICVGDQAYRSIIEHVRRAHENLYSKQRSTKEGWAKMLELNGFSASDMQRSVSNGSSSSGHSSNPQALQSKSVPRQDLSAPVPQLAQTPAMAPGNSQAPASEVHDRALTSAEHHRIASPEGPREFVHPYMLQHEAGQMSLYPQHGHAEAMGFIDQSGLVPAPFSMEQGSQEISRDVNGRQLSIDGALKPYFGDSIQPNQLDPTLGPSLFPSLSDTIAGSQLQPVHIHPPQNNGHLQHRISYGLAVQKQAGSRQDVEPPVRKRNRDETDDVNARGLERPLKRASAHSQSAVLDGAARQNPNAHPGFGGPIPPLTAEWFGLGLEKLTDNPFSVLTGPTIGELAVGISEPTKHQFREELRRRWPTADKLAVAPPERISALIVPLGLEPERAELLRDILQTLAKDYVSTPPTRHRRFGCKNYPRGASHNVTDGEVFEAEDKGLVRDVHTRNAAWEIGHLTKHHVAIDAWRIFCRDELLGRAQDWKGTGAAPGFEPEWKRVSPEDTALRTFVGWLWMKDGWFWDPLTGVKQPLPESTRLAVNKGCIHFNSQGRFFFRTSAGVLEPIDGSGNSPGMAAVIDMNGPSSMISTAAVSHSLSGAPNGLMHGLPASNGFTHGSSAPPANPALPFVDAGDNDVSHGASLPTDGPVSADGLAAFDNGGLDMFNGVGFNLGGDWNQIFQY